MPLPFILAGLAVGAGLVGAKKAYDAHSKNSEAESIQSSAQWLVDEAKYKLEEAREDTENNLKALGRTKVRVLNDDVKRFLSTFQQIHNVELSRSAGLNELSHFQMNEGSLAELRELGNLAEDLASGLASGTAAGGLVALGAYGGAMWLGTASTGTAIAALSGAAATNATLAFLGGGSLAAGGLGIAGGTAVLGGIIAGPALAVMGFMMDSKADENLERARGNYARAQRMKEELEATTDVCRAISRRAAMFTNLLGSLEDLFKPQIHAMEDIVRDAGTDYRQYNEGEKEDIAKVLATAAAIKSVLDTPILTESGALTEESAQLVPRIKGFLTTAQ